MADVQRGARLHDAAVVAKGGRQKLAESLRRHAIALERQGILGIAFVIHVVRRVREDQMRGGAAHEPRDVDLVGGIAHQQDAEIHFERVAVTLDQIDRWHLPTRPTKQTDPRLKGFQGESVEVDATVPSRLRRLARTCIERHIDHHALARTQEIEAEERSLFESTFGRLFSGGMPAASAPADLSALPDWPLDLPPASILLPSFYNEDPDQWTVLSGKAAEKIRRSIRAGKDAEDVAANYKITAKQVAFVVAMLDMCSVTPDDIAAAKIVHISPQLAAESRTLAALDRDLVKDVQAGRKTLPEALSLCVLKKLRRRER